MTKEQIRVGDVVKLNSNETLMTVQGISDDESIISVVWFDVHSNLNRASLQATNVKFVKTS